MEEKQNGKTPKVGPKSFLAVGPTLHYSHSNVQRCWLLALGFFCLACLFWTKIQTGAFISFSLESLIDKQMWNLGRHAVQGISIFEYPSQILVLGLLMGIISTIPVVISQLMSFQHSILFAAAIFFLADLPLFAVCVLISCIAAACRPLRFRSRFVAIALCMGPQLLYWGFLGSIKGADPIRWGFIYAPWICAWTTSLMIAGIIIGIGHFTRYRPGVVWITTAAMLISTVWIFRNRIGFDELDYQLYIAKNDPKKIETFHDHSIKPILDETINNQSVRRYLTGFFYPTDSIELRIKLKEKIQSQLRMDRWPSWLLVRDTLRYQQKRDELFAQYDTFITKRPKSKRMPIALYYKALLSEYSPDIDLLGQREILRFYSDYPFERSLQYWHQIYTQFPLSPESIEARWRIANHLAGHGQFDKATELLNEARNMAEKRLQSLSEQKPLEDTLFRLFVPPAKSAVSSFDLSELLARINLTAKLISPENRTDDPASQERLARFVMMNPYSPEYESLLDQLLQKIDGDDPLKDNILVAKTKVILDEKLRAERFAQIHEEFKGTDGGAQALYNLALLRIGFWRQQSDADPEEKKRLLAITRQTLEEFLHIYKDNFLRMQAKDKLDKLPSL
ncbi:MAG: hypothetical protein WCZ89_00760 [Phycisphaerae bacterium]